MGHADALQEPCATGFQRRPGRQRRPVSRRWRPGERGGETAV